MLTATCSAVTRLAFATAAMTLAAMTLTACSPESPGASQDSCTTVTPAPNTEAVTAVIDLGDLVTITSHDQQPELLTAEGVSARSVSELIDAVPEQLEGSRWDVVQVDDEGFESEIYVSGPRGELGFLKLRETDCAEQTAITVTISK